MTKTLTRKPLDFFKPDPNPARTSFDNDELTPMGESLKKKQHLPLTAMPDGTITDGHRRWLAAKLVGWRNST
jgi:ParB-like chromosome segregation protein Spo0J